jgi:hypothetical protein
MYRMNQRIILLVKMTVLLGVPLLSSFVVPWLSRWQIPSVLLVLAAYFLNNVYPDRIYLDERVVQVKLFLYPEWLEYPRTQVQVQQGRHCVYLYINGKRRYRISMERLSVRLYRQLWALLEPYEK